MFGGLGELRNSQKNIAPRNIMILQYIFLQPWPDIIVQQVGRWNDRIDGWGICKIKKNILEKNLEKDKIPITTLQIMKKS